MNRILLTLLVLLGLTACAKKPVETVIRIKEPIEVLRPVPVKAEAPAELLERLSPTIPEFVPPTDPGARAALTEDGIRALLAMITEMLTRIRAWETFYHTPVPGVETVKPPVVEAPK